MSIISRMEQRGLIRKDACDVPEEFVRRRQGKGGSWDPADMKLHSRLLNPSDVEENEQRLNDYRAKVEQAPRIQERPRFQAKLPKSRKSR